MSVLKCWFGFDHDWEYYSTLFTSWASGHTCYILRCKKCKNFKQSMQFSGRVIEESSQAAADRLLSERR